MTLEEIIFLNEKYGMTLEINDGDIQDVNFFEE